MNIISIFIIIMLGINMYICIKDYKKGLKLFIILSFTSPIARLGALDIEYFLLGSIPLMIIFFDKYKSSLKISYPFIKMFIYLILMILGLLIATYKYNVYDIGIINMLGCTIRVIFILVITNVFMDIKDYIGIIKIILLINFIVCICQLSIPNSTKLFYDLYYTEGLTPLVNVLKLGYFNRAYGTFSTPVRLGAYSLLCFTVFIFNTSNMYIYNYLWCLISAIIGILALSKSTIIGIPIILGYVLFASILKTKINVKKCICNIIIVFLSSIIIIQVISVMEKNGMAINWYLDKLKNPIESLSTRYSSDDGILVETNKVIAENMFLGVGSSNIKGEFLGDSQITVTLHETGILGSIIVIILLIELVVKSNYINKKKSIGILIVSIISGIALPIMFDLIGLIIIGIMYTLNKNNRGYCNDANI